MSPFPASHPTGRWILDSYKATLVLFKPEMIEGFLLSTICNKSGIFQANDFAMSLSPKKLHRAGRIDQVVRDYFSSHPSIHEIRAKDLMPLFIEKGIFLKDHRNGFPIRHFLRELDAAKKLSLLAQVKVIRHAVNRNWYFVKR